MTLSIISCNSYFLLINLLSLSLFILIGSSAPCLSLQQYFNPQVKQCLYCPTGCLQCCDQNLCSLCSPGYILQQSTSLCIQCPANCLLCDEQLKCIECREGSLMDLQGDCMGCSFGCYLCSNYDQCQQCSSGYHLVGGKCGACPPGCRQCVFVANVGYNCSECLEGYYLQSSTQMCIKCISPCRSCVSSTICSSCISGFYLDGSSCLPCMLNCFDCINSSSCTECVDGYYYNTTVCLSCTMNCIMCSNSTCTKCAQKYFLLLSSNTCIACQYPCLTCITPNSCSECPSNYYLSSPSPSPSTQQQCLPCLTNCLSCPNQHYCSICQQGYYFNGANCVSCGNYCRQCQQTSGQCLKCFEGFMIMKGKCIQCQGDVCSCKRVSLVEVEEKWKFSYGGRERGMLEVLFALLLLLLIKDDY